MLLSLQLQDQVIRADMRWRVLLGAHLIKTWRTLEFHSAGSAALHAVARPWLGASMMQRGCGAHGTWLDSVRAYAVAQKLDNVRERKA